MSDPTLTRRRKPDASDVVRRSVQAPSSYDPETRTFTAVIATTTPVTRSDGYGESYSEILSISPKSIRLARLQTGSAPLLNSHRSASLTDRIGVVTDVRIEGGQLVATARLSPRADVDPIAADFAAGTSPNVSVGYLVHSRKETTAADGQSVVTVTDWEPIELSLVAIPADPKTHIRSHQKGQSNMDEDLIDDTNERNQSADDRADAPTGAMSDRHARTAYDIAARAGLPAAFVRGHITAGRSLKDVRQLVIDELADRADRTRTSPAGDDSRTFANPEFLARTIEDALYAKMTGKPPTAAAAELAGRSMLDMGAMILESRGERVSRARRSDLAGQMMERGFGVGHTTSDFPMLLTGAGQRVLTDAYKASETPLKNLARNKTARDFRPVSAIRLSEAPRLLKVNEGGEIKHGSRAESKETFRVETYGRMFSISRQALINDDLNAFADTSADFGRAAAMTEADLLAALLLANNGDGGKLDDGTPVYAASRGNKAATGSAITVAALGLGRQAIRDTKGLDGITPISVTPKHLVVGSAKETEGEQVLATLAATQVGDTNPFSGKLTLHVEPRLPGNAWRLFADPSEITTIVMAYLDGFQGPTIQINEGWNVLGTEFRAVLDFGCAMHDWRGTYLNPGNAE